MNNNNRTNPYCNCSVDGMRVGMTYVPMQPWEELYDFDIGLRAGTIFPCLHLPFMGGDCNR